MMIWQFQGYNQEYALVHFTRFISSQPGKKNIAKRKRKRVHILRNKRKRKGEGEENGVHILPNKKYLY